MIAMKRWARARAAECFGGGAGERLSVRRAMSSAVAVFVLTSIHHIYGAIHYETFWRVHAVIVSGVATIAMAVSKRFMRSEDSGIRGLAKRTYILVGLLVPFLAFGVFEGGYNHAVKDFLYFAGMPRAVMLRMYPPSLYEMPNDVIFELTGVLQIVPAVFTGYYLGRFAIELRRRSGCRSESDRRRFESI